MRKLLGRRPRASAAKLVVRRAVFAHHKVSGGVAFAVVIVVPELLPQMLAASFFDASPVLASTHRRWLLFHHRAPSNGKRKLDQELRSHKIAVGFQAIITLVRRTHSLSSNVRTGVMKSD